MSYCVNCGVELAPSEPVCPLCHTEVQNPRQPFDRKAPQPFPARLDLFRPQSDRGFIAAILTLVLLLPAAICLACDVAYTSSAGWSMLVIGAVAMLWVFIVPALFIRRHPILFGLILDTAALLGYLFVVERFAARGLWFQHLALPIVVMVAGLFAVDYGLISKVCGANSGRRPWYSSPRPACRWESKSSSISTCRVKSPCSGPFSWPSPA